MRVMICSRLFILCPLSQDLMYDIYIHLITRYMCELDMIVYNAIIKYFFYPLLLVLLRYYLMYVKLQFRKYTSQNL